MAAEPELDAEASYRAVAALDKLCALADGYATVTARALAAARDAAHVSVERGHVEGSDPLYVRFPSLRSRALQKLHEQRQEHLQQLQKCFDELTRIGAKSMGAQAHIIHSCTRSASPQTTFPGGDLPVSSYAVEATSIAEEFARDIGEKRKIVAALAVEHDRERLMTLLQAFASGSAVDWTSLERLRRVWTDDLRNLRKR